MKTGINRRHFQAALGWGAASVVLNEFGLSQPAQAEENFTLASTGATWGEGLRAFGHETAIAEYVLMAMLVWSHRFREIESEFRARSSWRSSWVQSGVPHGEILRSTIGIVGLGRVGQGARHRAA